MDESREDEYRLFFVLCRCKATPELFNLIGHYSPNSKDFISVKNQ